MSKDINLAGIDFPIGLVHEWQIDFGYELNLGWLIGIRLPTNDLETVDAIFMYGMTWTNDSAIPLTHHNIVPILQSELISIFWHFSPSHGQDPPQFSAPRRA